MCVCDLGIRVNSLCSGANRLAQAVGPECGAWLTGSRLTLIIPLKRLRFPMAWHGVGCLSVLPSLVVIRWHSALPIRADPFEFEILAM